MICDDDDFGLEFSEDSTSETDVDLENQYYDAKAQKMSDPELALDSFKKVVELELGVKGEWGFKALKQIIKLQFKLNKLEEMMDSYKSMLTYIKSAITRNHSEKSINSILDIISTSKNMGLLQEFYEMTLEALKHGKNDRLWLKTNTKLGKLYYDRGEYAKLEKIVNQLKKSCKNDEGDDDVKKGTQLLEVYALEIQMYTAQKKFKNLKALYEKSLDVQAAIPHPSIMGIIRECGGKMHLREGHYHEALVDFFEAFKNFDEAGNARRTTSLKYAALASMLLKSDISPFDSQEAKPHTSDREILAMSQLVTAYRNNDSTEFENVLKANWSTIMGDPFIEEHVEDLLKHIHTEAIVKLIRPYSSISLAYISRELSADETAVENLLVSCILDHQINGKIDQVNRILLIDRKGRHADRYDAVDILTNRVRSLSLSIFKKFK